MLATRTPKNLESAWCSQLIEAGVHAQEVPLRGLSPKDAADLAATLSGGDPVAVEMSRGCAGHPFFITELCRRNTGGRAEDLRAFVDARLRLRSDAAQRLLALLAIHETPIDVKTAMAVARATPQAMDELIDEGMALRAGGRTARLEIAHGAWAESASRVLPAEELRMLQRDLADCLRRSIEPDHGAIAALFEASGDAFAAAEHALAAAYAFLKRLDFENAERSFLRALRNGLDDRQTREAYADALARAGRRRDSAAMYVEVARGLEGEARDERILRAAEYSMATGAIDEGMALVRPLLRELDVREAKSGSQGLLQIVTSASQNQWARGRTQPDDGRRLALCSTLMKGLSAVDPIASLAYGVMGLRFANRLDDLHAQALCRGYIGLVLGMSGSRVLTRMSKGMLARGHRDAERAGPAARTWMRAVDGVLLVGQARWREGYRHLEAAFDEEVAGSRPEMHWETAAARTTQLLALQCMGDYESLPERAAALAELAVLQDDRFVAIESSIYLADAALARGRAQEAIEGIDTAMKNWRSLDYSFQEWLAANVQMRALLHTGDLHGCAKRFARESAAAKKAGLFDIIVVRLQAAQLVLALEGQGGSVRNRELRAWTRGNEAWALALRARMAGQTSEAVARYRQADMEAHALAVELRSDGTNARASASLLERGIHDPSRWALTI